MKVVAVIARILLGIMFTVFGLNGFLHFLPNQPMSGLPLQYFTVLVQSQMVGAIFAIQLITGLLFLSGLFVPLALVINGAVIANILLFHIYLAPAGIGPGLLAFVLWLITFWSVRSHFAGIFVMRTRQES